MLASDYTAIVSVLISLTAVVYTYLTNTKKYELQSQYRDKVIAWFSETTGILLRLRTEAQENFPDIPMKRDLLSKLAAKIEVGRLYFPNVDRKDGFGSQKSLAYRGYRNLILDFLVFSYRLFERPDASKYLNHADELQKLFTSYIFEITDPRKFLKETEKLTKNVFSKELSFEDYLDKDPDLILEYIKE